MIKRSLYEELYIYIDKEELAQLFGADRGFSVQHVEEDKTGFRFMLSPETTLGERSSPPQRPDISREQAERQRFL
jgi:hypothetical protein